MDSLSPNTALTTQTFAYSNESSFANLENSRFAKQENKAQEKKQTLFRKQDGKAWVVIVREPSGGIKAYSEQKGSNRKALSLKGIPSYLPLESINKAKAVLNRSKLLLTDYSVEVIIRLKGGMINSSHRNNQAYVDRIDQERGLQTGQLTPLENQTRPHAQPAPYDRSEISHAPSSAVSGFGINLPQTDIIHFISSDNVFIADNISTNQLPLLSNVVKLAYKSVGLIRNYYSQPCGSCCLISNHYVLMARHILTEIQDIQQLHVIFGYIRGSCGTYSSRPYRLLHVVEEDEELDYAIVSLANSPGANHRYMQIDRNSPQNTSLALLHYPLGDTLKVSVHSISRGLYASANGYSIGTHDSNNNSSGGAYLTPEGKLVALHIGRDTIANSLQGSPLSRYFLEVERIVSKSFILSAICAGIANPPAEVALRGLGPSTVNAPLDPEKNRNSERLAARQSQELLRMQAKTFTIARLLGIQGKNPSGLDYEVLNVRALSVHPNFNSGNLNRQPKLGSIIFSTTNIENILTASSNKTIFRNPQTGWYICHDQSTHYNTVIDDQGFHKALDGSSDLNGQDTKYHFWDTQQAKNNFHPGGR